MANDMKRCAVCGAESRRAASVADRLCTVCVEEKAIVMRAAGMAVSAAYAGAVARHAEGKMAEAVDAPERAAWELVQRRAQEVGGACARTAVELIASLPAETLRRIKARVDKGNN